MAELTPAKPTRERWRIIVEATGEGPPVYVRLRRLLKHMLRAFGIRCVSMVQEPPPAGKGDTHADA